MAALKYSKDYVYIFSYNSRGFTDEKQAVCRDLMLNADNYFPILCNQEDFLLHINRYKVTLYLPNTRTLGVETFASRNFRELKNSRNFCISRA